MQVVSTANHLVKWCIEEDVAIGRIGHQHVERGVAGSDYGNRAFVHAGAVEVCEVASLTERFELRGDVGPEIRARSFEIDQEDQSLGRICVEDAIWWCSWRGSEFGNRILLLEDVEEWIYVKRFESAIWCESIGVVSNVELPTKEPDIRLNAYTANIDGGKERHFTPVVIVGMACDWFDVACEVGRPMIQAF